MNASALDIIAGRFEAKRPIGTTSQADDIANNIAGDTPGPNTNDATYIVAKFPPLGAICVVTVIDRSLAERIKKKFAGHSLWTVEELIFFMERFFTLETSPKTKNTAKWCLSDSTERSFDLTAAQEHFLTVCRAKAEFNAFLSKRDF